MQRSNTLSSQLEITKSVVIIDHAIDLVLLLTIFLFEVNLDESLLKFFFFSEKYKFFDRIIFTEKFPDLLSFGSKTNLAAWTLCSEYGLLPAPPPPSFPFSQKNKIRKMELESKSRSRRKPKYAGYPAVLSSFLRLWNFGSLTSSHSMGWRDGIEGS